MPSAAERIAVVETKVVNLEEKIDDVQNDIRSNHSTLLTTLKDMQDASSKQHGELANKIKELEGFKNRYIRWGMMTLAFLAGAGWLGNPSMTSILKFIGL